MSLGELFGRKPEKDSPRKLFQAAMERLNRGGEFADCLLAYDNAPHDQFYGSSKSDERRNVWVSHAKRFLDAIASAGSLVPVATVIIDSLEPYKQEAFISLLNSTLNTKETQDAPWIGDLIREVADGYRARKDREKDFETFCSALKLGVLPGTLVEANVPEIAAYRRQQEAQKASLNMASAQKIAAERFGIQIE